MADLATTQQDETFDNASDYGDFGSDAEEIQILDELLAQVTSQYVDTRVDALLVTDIEDYEPPHGILLPKNTIVSNETRQEDVQFDPDTECEVLRDFQTKSADAKSRSASQERGREATAPAQPAEPDNRPPLERYRKPPKKALSVTDLVSPAWCELQYYYVLSKHGQKRRTPAMKQGTAVHQALENEVHTTVPVEITKVEDSWGLRFWNICQGLRTLRETGRTRELEIWGTIGGEMVNGVIDELSYECPDPKYEENLKAKAKSRRKNEEVPDLPEYQTSITEYLMSRPEKNSSASQDPSQSTRPTDTGKRKTDEPQKSIYIIDIKTRTTPTLPTGSSLRPTIVQLHLYHHLLENLVQGNFPLSRLAERYGLDVDEPFSDALLAQLGNLNQDMFGGSSQASADEQIRAATLANSQDSMDLLFSHNTLATLWQYTMDQLRTTFVLDEPANGHGTSQPKNQNVSTDSWRQGESALGDNTSITVPPPSSQLSTSDLPPPPEQATRLSPLLTAKYLAANYPHSKTKSSSDADPNTTSPSTRSATRRILGHKSVSFNPAFLKAYLEASLAWWRGQRPADGVSLQEAWKCRSCEFRDGCEWLLERDDEAKKRVEERKKLREAVKGNGTGGQNDVEMDGADAKAEDVPETNGKNGFTRSRV